MSLVVQDMIRSNEIKRENRIDTKDRELTGLILGEKVGFTTGDMV